MATKTNRSSNGLVASALLMLLALVWLTVSTPFVYASQQQLSAGVKSATEKAEEQDNPLSGTNEEKSENGVSSVSEYLHEVLLPLPLTSAPLKFEKCHPSDLYFAFHPELLCPPPNGVC